MAKRKSLHNNRRHRRASKYCCGMRAHARHKPSNSLQAAYKRKRGDPILWPVAFRNSSKIVLTRPQSSGVIVTFNAS